MSDKKTYFTTYNKDNCPSCGCGFSFKSDDGENICLYCPERWYSNEESK